MNYFYTYSIPGLWILWLLYWKMAAGNVKATRRHETFSSRATYVPLFFLGVFFVAIFTREPGDSPLFAPIWPRTLLGFWLGFALMLLGFAFTIWARLVLGRNWSSSVTLKENHELIQTGPYGWVRHPIYTGLLIAFIGTVVAMDEWRGVAGFLCILVSFLIKLRIEERWMVELFGPAYLAYRKRVGMLVPFPPSLTAPGAS